MAQKSMKEVTINFYGGGVLTIGPVGQTVCPADRPSQIKSNSPL